MHKLHFPPNIIKTIFHTIKNSKQNIIPLKLKHMLVQ